MTSTHIIVVVGVVAANMTIRRSGGGVGNIVVGHRDLIGRFS